MATTFTSATLSGSYDDDLDQDKGFHQILFNSGRALQARELTQLQSLIYQEMGRFGRNIFKEGAAVSSGGMAINAAHEFVKIASTNAGSAFANIPVGTVFRDDVTGLEARVLEVQPRNTGLGFTYDTLYVQYINTDQSVVAGLPDRFGDKVTLFDQSGSGYELVTETPNASGRGVRFDVATGDFFVLGRFVKATTQNLIISPYTQSFTGAIGFKVVQEVISVSDDASLYDNNGGAVNTASPGADRYRIRLILCDHSTIASDETFVFLANVENSKIVEEVDEGDAYNKINELIALRTEEESGDYIVNPYTIHFEDEVAGDSSLELIVSTGSAYVNGYRVDTPSPVKLKVPRPQTTDNRNNDIVPIEYGNYFVADSGRGLPNLDMATVNLSTSLTDPSSNTIGTARIRAVEKGSTLPNNGTHKIYVFDINVDSDKDLTDIKSIGTSTTNLYKLSTAVNGAGTDSDVKLFNTQDNSLLMPLTQDRLQSISDIVLKVQRHVGSKTVASSKIDISSVLGAGESFVDTSNWVVASTTRGFIPHTVNASNGEITLSDVADGVVLEVLYYVQKTGAVRTKTELTGITDTLTKQTGFDVYNDVAYCYYEFDHVDVTELDSVRATFSSGLDMFNSFILDDGQRDNFYQRARLIHNGEDSAPNNLYVNYKRLRHNNDGDFFAASSYNTINYRDIPTHVNQTGNEVNLFNYLDFRSDNDNGTFANINFLPKNGDNVTADISYYLPRADKLLLTQEGELQLLMGNQAADPQFKPTPENALELYKIKMNPNTLNGQDLSFDPVEHRHYTMKDISNLEDKVDALSESTALSILELRNLLSPSLDSAGEERLAIGNQSDDQSDHDTSDTENVDYSASLDPDAQIIYPKAAEENIRLMFNNSLSTGVTKIGDNIYLNHDSAEWAFQSLASDHIKVNPFGHVQNTGTLKMSPSSDEWKDTQTNANRAIEGSENLSTNQAFLWNSWQWNWQGRVGLITRSIKSAAIRKRYAGRTVDLALIPFIRSRKVFFHAKGLKPNTRFTPFFDGMKVSEWCREESTFVRWSDRTDGWGNRYGWNIAAHPQGSSDLISDANGEIIGSYFIPSVRAVREKAIKKWGKKAGAKYFTQRRFRAGVREFMLLDIDKPDWGEAGSKAFCYYAAMGIAIHSLNIWKYLRYPDSPHPYSWLSKRAQTRLTKEQKERLDAVSAGNVLITEPKVSGRFGTNQIPLTTTELRNIDNKNTMSTVLSDYIGVDLNHQASTEVNPIAPPENPLSQTFYVDNPYGLVLTKLQLYFRSKDTGNLPVSIHIRPVENGKPSQNIIVPDSHVFKNPGDVDAIGTTPILSTVQSRPTTFEFDEPIHLQPWKRYAIVVSSQSTEYELFSATAGNPVLGSSVKRVTTQPIPGTLFLPQNGTNWLETKNQDLMYRLYRAKFNQGGGSLILNNEDLAPRELEDNPILTTALSNRVFVKHMCHGLRVGDIANLDSAEGFFGNTAADFNGNHTVQEVDVHGYTIDVDSATFSGFGGGDKIRSQGNVVFTTANLILENAIPRSTSIDTSAKFTSGSNISGGETRFVQDAQYARITPEENTTFDSPKTIYNAASETLNLGAGVRSAYFKVDFKSGDDYVSPIIDLQRSSLVAAGYCIDDPSITPHLYPVSETAPTGGTTASKHITKVVVLPEPAVGIDARGDCWLPDSSDVDFYYRTAQADEDITLQPWILQEPREPLPRRNDGNYNRAEYLAGGQNGTLKPFNQAQTKWVMKAGSIAPAIKNLAISFLAH